MKGVFQAFDGLQLRRPLLFALAFISLLITLGFGLILLERINRNLLEARLTMDLVLSSVLESTAKNIQALAGRDTPAEYRRFFAIENLYNQLRVLDAKGMEVFRLNKKDGLVEAVPAEALQDKSDRYYFREMRALARGAIYVSRIDFNVEGKTELKSQITFRVARERADGKYLVLNVDGAYLQERIAHFRNLAFSVDPRPEKSLPLALLKGTVSRKVQVEKRLPLSLPYHVSSEPWQIWITYSLGQERAALLILAAFAMASAGLIAFLHRYLGHKDNELRKMRSLIERAFNESLIYSVTDSRGRVTLVNDKFVSISGYSREELLGKDHRIINSGYHAPDFFRQMWKTIQAGKVWTGKIRNRKKNGEYYWVYSIIIPNLDSEHKVESFSAVRFDITRQVDLEARMTAFHGKSSANVNKMSASLVHQFSTPIAIIHSSADILEYLLPEEVRKNKDVEEQIRHIRITLGRMISLTDLFKKLGRKSSARPTAASVANLGEVIADALLMSQAILGANAVEVRFSQSNFGFEVSGDHILLVQVFLNLISNSVDELVKQSQGRWIDIRLGNLSGLFREVSFTDSGKGIPAHIAENIFESYFSTKDLSAGTGLGLSLSREILDFYGGGIDYLATEPNTTFSIKLREAGHEANAT